MSAAAHKLNDFEPRARGKRGLRPAGPADDLAVEFDSDALGVQSELGQQSRERGRLRLPVLAVYHNPERLCGRLSHKLV